MICMLCLLQCCLIAQKCGFAWLPPGACLTCSKEMCLCSKVSLPKPDVIWEGRKWTKENKCSPFSGCPRTELCQNLLSVYYKVLFSPKRTLLRVICAFSSFISAAVEEVKLQSERLNFRRKEICLETKACSLLSHQNIITLDLIWKLFRML